MAKSGLAKQHKKPARRLSVSNRVETLIQKTFAEFFAGIGLMRRGLEKEGWSVSFANDIDPKKHEMYVENFEDADKDFLLGDVHEIPADVIPNVTLATASFPCTDLSLAGGREGLNGTQSSAFWGFVRVLRDMGERKPKLVLLENVLGFLTSHEGWDFFEAMTALNRLGYSVDAFVLDAAWFVPQSRQRLFVVGILDHQLVERNLEVRETEFRPRQLVEFINNHSEINWRVRDLPPRPNRRQALDLILEDLDDDSKEWWSSERAEYLLNQMSERHREIAERMITGDKWSYGTVFRRVRNGKTMAELRTDGIAGCLRTPKGGSAKQILFKAGFGKYFARLLTPRECARLMGADDYKISVSENQALFGFGDAVCVPVVQWIAKNYLNPVFDELLDGQSTTGEVKVACQ